MLYPDPFQEIRPKYASLLARKELVKATFAGGCFWCLEAPFEQLDGVIEVVAGYTGGTVADPEYEQVIRGNTGHREAVQVFYDPQKVSYQKLLDIFWLQIDPLDPGGQFADRGRQYTTAIYYHTDEQKKLAEQSRVNTSVARKYTQAIATSIEPATVFYPAEDYHQDFHLTNSAHYRQYKRLSGREDFVKQAERQYKQQ